MTGVKVFVKGRGVRGSACVRACICPHICITIHRYETLSVRELANALSGLQTCFAPTPFSTEDVDNLFHKNSRRSFHTCHLSQLCLSLQLKISRKEVGAKEIGTGTLAEYLG